MKYKCAETIEAWINNPRMEKHLRPLDRDERSRLHDLLNAIVTEANRLELKEDIAEAYFNGVLKIYFGCRHHEHSLSWGVINPLKPLEATKKNVKLAAKSFRALADVPQNVLMTIFMSYLDNRKLDGRIRHGLVASELFTREGFRQLAEECEKQLTVEKAPFKQAARSRRRGYVRQSIINELYYVWINHLKRSPKTSRGTAFYSTVKALFAALKLPGENEPEKIIRAEFNKPYFSGHDYFRKTLGTA